MWLVRVVEGGGVKASIAEAVLARAAGRCECGCGLFFDSTLEGSVELDHFLSRREPDSEGTIWALRRACHLERTLNRPSAAEWLKRFLVHAEKHGYRASYEKALRRLQFVTARGELGKGAA